MMVRLRGSSLLVAVALALSSCGDGESVGGRELTTGLGDAADLERLGEEPTSDEPTATEAEATPSDVEPSTAAPTPASPTAGPPSASPSPSANEAGPTAFTIEIHPDGASDPQFAPRFARVPVFTVVEWVNLDTVERSVIAYDNSFASPAIPPGGTWAHRFDATGTFDYFDGTRLYAQGTVEVVP